MAPDEQRARAIAHYVREKYGDLWTQWNLGRYAYHIGVPFEDNPGGPDGEWWGFGWLNERNREADHG